MSELEGKTTQNDTLTSEGEPVLPKFTLKNVLSDIKGGIHDLLFNPDFNKVISPLLVLFEVVLVKLIRKVVPYTEIDYTAYMEQINIIKSGELNYSHIFGNTGPLVYPAGHIWIYRFLDWLTYGTETIEVGQSFFGYLYVLTLIVVLLIYSKLRVPPWVLFMLVCSKRLHSIYVLRLFNDCFTTFFMVITILTLQLASVIKRQDPRRCFKLTNFVSSTFYAFAIAVKMNALLYVPGFLIVVYFLNDENLLTALLSVFTISVWQVILSWRFLFNGPEVRNSYFSRAFDLQRRFLYQWTVNWKFLSQDVFNSVSFHHLLLVLQLFITFIFVTTKWCSRVKTAKPLKQTVIDFFKFYKPTLSASHIINDPEDGPVYIMGVMISSNLIGVLCARSLHYQFLSWYAWSYPYLIYLTNLNWIVSIALFAAHEWCWNVYPATNYSSGLLFALNSVVLLAYWSNERRIGVHKKEEKKRD